MHTVAFGILRGCCSRGYGRKVDGCCLSIPTHEATKMERHRGSLYKYQKKFQTRYATSRILPFSCDIEPEGKPGELPGLVGRAAAHPLG